MLSIPVAEGTILAGKYRVEHVLGRGGMGVVVSAWHLELDQRVALKFLSNDLAENADAAERFRREARAAARIRSEHVVRVLDVGVMNDAAPYMVMEYLEGHDLDDEVTERGALPISDAVDYVLQAIEALAEAHAAGIVHRDLKPGNLFLLERRDGTRMIKVLDFGISKSLPGTGSSADQMVLTATASLIGSPLYMSPEQMQAPRSVDQRTDIWSLGAILYHALTGRPPYPAENIAQLCSMLLNTAPTPLTQLRSDVTPELDRVVLRCLERDRDRRFSNVSELASALGRFASAMSHVHVSRAARILSSPGLETATKTLSSDSENSAQPAGTQSAWQRESHKPKNSRARVLVPLALGALALAAGVAIWAFRADAPPATNSGPEPRAAAADLGAVAPAPATQPSPVAPAATAEPTVPPSAPPSASSALPSAAAGMATVSASASVAKAKPPAFVAKPKAPSAASVAPKSAPPAGDAAGLTDFGGRR